jgi:hypothetical protein
MDDINLIDGEWEDAGDGRQVKRDIDGRIIETRLSSETARAMGAGNSRNRNRKHQQDISDLLVEAGYPNPDEAPTHLKTLAAMAVSGRSGSVSALVQFIRHTRVGGPVENTPVPEIGSICPTCKQHVGELSGEVLHKILAALNLEEKGRKLAGDKPAGDVQG